jgi:hypothetical protein
MRGSAARVAIGTSGSGAIEKCSPMSMLRASGRKRGMLGSGAPGGAPGVGVEMLPVKKWFWVSMTMASSEPRTAVMSELPRSSP